MILEKNQMTALPPEMSKLVNMESLYAGNNQLTSLPPEIGQLTSLVGLDYQFNELTFPPPEIQQQGLPAMLAYLRDYEAMLQHQKMVGIVIGVGVVGAMAGLIVAFRWRQRRGLGEKKKRL